MIKIVITYLFILIQLAVSAQVFYNKKDNNYLLAGLNTITIFDKHGDQKIQYKRFPRDSDYPYKKEYKYKYNSDDYAEEIRLNNYVSSHNYIKVGDMIMADSIVFDVKIDSTRYLFEGMCSESPEEVEIGLHHITSTIYLNDTLMFKKAGWNRKHSTFSDKPLQLKWSLVYIKLRSVWRIYQYKNAPLKENPYYIIYDLDKLLFRAMGNTEYTIRK